MKVVAVFDVEPIPNLAYLTGPQICTGPDGALWICDLDTQAIIRCTTVGSFSSFPLPSSWTPWAICLGPTGDNLWMVANDGTNTMQVFTVSTSGIIASLASPLEFPGVYNGVVSMAPGPDNTVCLFMVLPAPPYEQWELVFATLGADGTGTFYSLGRGVDDVGEYANGLVVDGSGNLWGITNYVIALCTPDGTITTMPGGTGSDGALGAMTLGPDGNVWFTVGVGDRYSPPSGSLNSVTVEGEVTTYTDWDAPLNNQPIITGSDGNIWGFAADFSAEEAPFGVVQRFNTTTHEVAQFAIPTYPPANSDGLPQLFSVCVGSDDNLYFTGGPYASNVFSPLRMFQRSDGMGTRNFQTGGSANSPQSLRNYGAGNSHV
jgi:streptogramin lyase